MDLQETYNQIDSGVKEKQKLFFGNSAFSLKKLILFFGLLTFLSWYGYIVLFGENSYSLVRDLELEKLELQIEIKELRKDNSKLQRSYFNLKVADESYRDGL